MISSVTDNLPVPSKIIEWLRFKGLFGLVRPKNISDSASNAAIKITDGRRVQWTSSGRTFFYYCEAVPCGCVFLEEENICGSKPQGLACSMEGSIWLSPGLIVAREKWMDEAAVPPEVILPEAILCNLFKWAKDETPGASWTLKENAVAPAPSLDNAAAVDDADI